MQQALRAQTAAGRAAASRPRSGARRHTSCCATTRSRSDRWNRLHPDEPPRVPLVTELLREPAERGPIVAVSDFITAWPDMVARWVPGGWYAHAGH